MKQDKIFIVVKKPGGNPEIKLAEKDPKVFSGIVEGKREIIPFAGLPGVCVIFDGEAVQKQKKPNCFLPEYNDLICGTVIFSSIDFETGFVSLTEGQAGVIEEYLKLNDAKGINDVIEERVAAGYLSHTEENYIFGMLCEVKTKYKSLKVKWLGRR